MKKLSYLLWIMFFFCSCQDDKREQFMRLVQEWQGKEIRFPKEITFTRFVTDTMDYQIPTSDYKDTKLKVIEIKSDVIQYTSELFRFRSEVISC